MNLNQYIDKEILCRQGKPYNAPLQFLRTKSRACSARLRNCKSEDHFEGGCDLSPFSITQVLIKRVNRNQVNEITRGVGFHRFYTCRHCFDDLAIGLSLRDQYNQLKFMGG
jgi:hypothetical protein